MKISPFLLSTLFVCCAASPGLLRAQTPDVGQQAPNESQTQAPTSAPQSGQAPQDVQKEQNPDKSQPEGVSKDRLFYTLPNFLTLENSGPVPPLSTKEKFKVVTKGSFDYVLVPWYAFLAGLSQAQNSEAGYGQGAEGYAKRFGAYFADGTIENYVTSAILPSLLRQDPRYFQSGKGSFTHRAGYAMSRIFVTRSDSGHQQFNFSEIVGGALSAGISTYSYHPHEDRTLPNTLSVWGTQVATDTLTLVVREFWPDIRRKISKTKKERGQ